MRWLAVAVLLVSGMAGCVQVDLPASQAPAPVAAEQPAAPSSHPVTCLLADGNGTPLGQGSCEWRFGERGASVSVNASGAATRNVAAGSTGTVSGFSAGHAPAKATVTVDGPKLVRMTLPALPAHEPKVANRTAPANDAGNTTQEAAATAELETFESRLDTLLAVTHSMPLSAPSKVYPFAVAAGYDVIELRGKHELFVDENLYAQDLTVEVKDSSGTTVLSWGGFPSAALVAVSVVGPGLGNFSLGFIYSPTPGTYTLEVTGAGTWSGLQLTATGLAGAAPDFTYFDVMNGTFGHLHDLNGRVLIIDLMATWCGPCQEAMPGFKKVKAAYHGQVEVMSIDVDKQEDAATLRAFRDTYGADWVFGLDEGSSAWEAYGSGFIPTVVLIDQHGGLLFRNVGEISEARLHELIDFALAER